MLTSDTDASLKVVLDTSTLAHRCRRRGVHPIINALSACSVINEVDKTILFKIETSTYPNFNGSEQKRGFTLVGDEFSEHPVETKAATTLDPLTMHYGAPPAKNFSPRPIAP